MQNETYYLNLVEDALNNDSETATESYEILQQLADIVMTKEEREIMKKQVSSHRVPLVLQLIRIANLVIKRKRELEQNRRPVDRSSIQF
jgi:hypothetical protein